MNIDDVKDNIRRNLNKMVEIKVHGNRGRNATYVGYIQNAYPAIFTVSINGLLKSFNYVDVLTGEIKIDYY